MKTRAILVSFAVVCLWIPALGTSKVIATIPVGAFPNSIAVNLQTNKVYVANYLGGSVSVIDGASNTIEATVKVDHPMVVVPYVARNQIFVYTAYQGLAVIDGVTNRMNGPH